MISGGTAERVYNALKRRILERAFRPGERLDPTVLGEELNSSATPVRDALHRLAGEQLVEVRTSDGFHLPQIDAPGLQDLYAWHAEVAGLALRRWRPRPGDDKADSPDLSSAGAIADASATLFARVAGRSPNIEHRRALASLGDRLHAARLAEAQVLDGVADELGGLHEALAAAALADARRVIAAYHRRRERAAAEIVRVLYRNGQR